MALQRTKSARQRYSALKRWRKPGDPELLAAKRDLEAERLAAHAQKIIDDWPELTPEQKARIAILLRPSRGRS